MASPTTIAPTASVGSAVLSGIRAIGRSARTLASTPTGLIGVVVTVLVVAVGLFGPLLAPHPPDRSISIPFDGPSWDYPFGLDYLGRDVFSRWLSGGRSVLLLASAATIIGVVGGLVIGLVAAYRRDWVDGALMRSTDLILGFPPLLLFLLVLVSFGNRLVPLVAVVGRVPRHPHVAARACRRPRRDGAPVHRGVQGAAATARRTSSPGRCCPTSSAPCSSTPASGSSTR